MDLYKAGIVVLTDLCKLGPKDWDYVDRRRVVVQRSAITRERPAMRAGWSITCDIQVLIPEYIDKASLQDVLVNAGRLVGIGDFRPTFGRFQVDRFEIIRLAGAAELPAKTIPATTPSGEKMKTQPGGEIEAIDDDVINEPNTVRVTNVADDTGPSAEDVETERNHRLVVTVGSKGSRLVAYVTEYERSLIMKLGGDKWVEEPWKA